MPTTSANVAQLLGTAATAYGVLAALSVLLQARQMLARRASCEVSVRFFASYAGGYAIWLLYGLSVSSTPLIVVDAVGLLCAGLTLAVALSLRGSLIHPTTWKTCDSIPVSQERPVQRLLEPHLPETSPYGHSVGSAALTARTSASRLTEYASSQQTAAAHAIDACPGWGRRGRRMSDVR